MRMIFEIRDLKYATPATVSRAGILYISTDDGTQWISLIQSWLKHRDDPENIRNAFQVIPTSFFAWNEGRSTTCPLYHASPGLCVLKQRFVPSPGLLRRVCGSMFAVDEDQRHADCSGGRYGPRPGRPIRNPRCTSCPKVETQGTWQNVSKSWKAGGWQYTTSNVFSLWQVLLYMMDGLLTPANTSTVEELEKVFVFCMIWAMGSALTVSDDGTDYQKLFSDWWRGEWKKVWTN